MRRLLAIVGAVALAAVLSMPAIARGNEPLQLVTDHRSVACNVEQQTIRWYGQGHLSDPCPGEFVVNNPTGCPWDIDDSWSMVDTSGSIATGQTVTATFCGVSDGTHRAPVDAAVRAKHDKLTVRIDASDGRSWVAVPVRDGNEYEYTACGDNFLPAPHPEVPDSNGGQGTLVTYVLTIAAPTRGANNVFALLKYGQGIWTTCA